MTSSANSNFCFLTGWGLIANLATMLLLAATGFILHIPVSFLHFPLALVITFTFQFSIARTYLQASRAIVIRSIITICLLWAISIVVCSLLYDLSYDGQTYHQEIIYQLKNGWSPCFQKLPDTISHAIWVNHYSKGAEIPQAIVYSFTRHIESGKAVNIIAFAGALLLSLYFIPLLNKVSARKGVWLAVLINLNPVVFNQFFTYNVDGVLASLLLCMVITSYLLYQQITTPQLLLFAANIILILNIKFTGIVFAGLFIIALLSILLFSRKHAAVRKVFVTAAIATITGICLAGFNPYITNTKLYHNPLYPLIGKGKVDIMTHNSPLGFPEKNRLEKLYISLFSHTDNIWLPDVKQPSLKIPFTFNKTDISNASLVDPRIAGFGPFFSGILLLSVITLLIILTRRKEYAGYKTALYLLVVLGISILIIEEAWWARYVPQLWLIPFVVLLLAGDTSKGLIKPLTTLTRLAIAGNLLFCLISIPWNMIKTAEIDYQLSALQTASAPIRVTWHETQANRIRFEEKAIAFRQDSLYKGKDSIVAIPRSNALIAWPADARPVSEPFLLKCTKRLKWITQK